MFDYLTLVQVTQILRMVFDILIVWLILQYIIRIVRSNNKTSQIFKGIIFVLIIQAIAKYLGLKTLAYLTDNIINWGFLALIIIFQPEIRSLLERMGKSNIFSRISTLSGDEKEVLVQALMDAVSNLAESKTGALITLEQTASLSDYIQTGVKINSIISPELLCSIFSTTTQLHDGAVIIQGDKIACASAYFPPTTLDLPSRYGARHRAAIGISELTDAITIVISEETGRVAIASEGKLLQVNERKLREYLNMHILNKDSVTSETVSPTGSESVSLQGLFRAEVETLEKEDITKKLTVKEEPATPARKSVIIIDENDERVEDEEDLTRKGQMKTFKKQSFKDDTLSIPVIAVEVDNTDDKPVVKNEEKPVEPKKEVKPTVIKKEIKPVEVKKEVKPVEVKTEEKPVEVKTEEKPKPRVKNEEELKAEVQAEIQQALNTKKTFDVMEEPAEDKKKSGLFHVFGKDKQKKPTTVVEQAVKDVAKEFHTTQQLKLKEIQEADAMASEAAKKKLEETKRIVLPSVPKKPAVQKPKKEITDAPLIKPLEITRVSRQSAKKDETKGGEH